jgi:glycosyltransferase involved in cell wall biosynthesis
MISDAYPPMRTSCATQIYDLAQAFIEQGHQVSIIIPAHSQKNVVEISNLDGPTVFSVRCFKTKDVSYLRRTLAEFINPFLIGFHLKRNQRFIAQKIDGITWYSPTIFWGPLVKQLKALFNCKAYLILRDIFPDWALDLGLLKKNLIYSFFKRVERYQYEQADTIGVQSPNNVGYFNSHNRNLKAKVHVLWNWIGTRLEKKAPILINETSLVGRKIFIYAGNMGIAQDMGALQKMVGLMRNKKDIGFIFVGRGSEKSRLEFLSQRLELNNILFFDEIENDQLDSLLRQCHVGLISLNTKHTTHNIPGKFLSYLHAGLPVMALLNVGNDLIELINLNNLGIAITNTDEVAIVNATMQALLISQEEGIASRCQTILNQNFLAKFMSKKIQDELS